MTAANQSDFFGEGVAAGAFAPLETPAQAAERARLERVRLEEERRRSADAAAIRNAPYQNQVRAAQPEQARQENITRNSSAGEAGNDWLYPAIVAGTITAGIGGAALAGGAGAATGGAALASPYAAGGAYAAPYAGAYGVGTGAAAAAPAFSAVGPASGAVTSAAAPTVLSAGGGAGLAGGAAAAAPAAASWLTPANAMAAGGLLLQGGALVANQIRTKAEKDLIKKQEEIAAAADARRAQVQQEGMNRLGQTMLAMNPMNQTMADMFGPSAAYTPDQMAGMVADPGSNPAAAGQRFDDNSPSPQFSIEDIQRANADKKRQDMVRANTSPLGPGPAQLQQRAPQAARRF